MIILMYLHTWGLLQKLGSRGFRVLTKLEVNDTNI